MTVKAPREVEGMVLFEVYEANGSLLYVSSTLDRAALEPGDTVYRRAWATAAPFVRIIPREGSGSL